MPGNEKTSAVIVSSKKSNNKNTSKRQRNSSRRSTNPNRKNGIKLSKKDINNILASNMSVEECGMRLDSRDVDKNENNVKVGANIGRISNENGNNDNNNNNHNNDNSNDNGNNNNNIVLPSCPESKAAAKLFINKHKDGIHNFLDDKTDDQLSVLIRDSLLMFGAKINFIDLFMSRILNDEVKLC